MKKLIVPAVALVLTITMVRCASKKATTASAPATAKTEEGVNAPADPALEEGKTIWQGACNKCHKLYAPEAYTVEKWEVIIPRMAAKAKLDETQTAKVHAYLIAHAKTN